MSWFDTSNLANFSNIATKAMKEAQKTLDKALDIDEDESGQPESKWADWGKQLIKSDSQVNAAADVDQPATNIQQQPKLKESVWGSFAGSFFVSQADEAENKESTKTTSSPPPSSLEPVATQPTKKDCEIPSSVAAAVTSSQLEGRRASVNQEKSIGSSQSQSSLMEGCSEAEILEFSENCDIRNVDGPGEFSSSRLVVSSSPTNQDALERNLPPQDTDPPYYSNTNQENEVGLLTSPTSAPPTCDNPVIMSASLSSSSSCPPSPSIEVVSPSSIEILTPSSVEVIQSDELASSSGEASPTKGQHYKADLKSAKSTSSGDTEQETADPTANGDPEESFLTESNCIQDVQPNSVDLNSSISSDKTLVDRTESITEQACLESMLDEAMIENEKKSCGGSSHGSELAKLECPSETSCDEMDNYTSTSSDLEVISSPHTTRSLVLGRPTSSASDELYQAELTPRSTGDSSERSGDLHKLVDAQKCELVDLRKKNNDLTELVQARESRLLALSREIGEVQEESGQMSVRLEAALKEADDLREAAEAHKEAANRLKDGLAEQAKERADLEKQLAKTKAELKQKNGDDDEKDEIIRDLRSEGEALAKQNGKQAETIRKLRAKDKTNDTESTKLKAEIEKLKTEQTNSNKSLVEKEEKVAALGVLVKSLTEANQSWEVENKKMKVDLEDNLEKVNGLRSSLESAYREMAELKTKLTEAKDEANTEALSNQVAEKKAVERELEEERRAFELERLELEARINNAQAALMLCEKTASDREEVSRREVENIRLRLEASENRHEDLSESISQASKPLLRQVESLQSALKESQANSDRMEQNLAERLRQATTSLTAVQERERSVADQYRVAAAKLAALEAQEKQVLDTRRGFEEKLNEMEAAAERLTSQRNTEAANDRLTIMKLREELAENRREREFLSVSLESEKAEGETRRKKSLALMDQLKERDRRVRELQTEMDTRHSVIREESVRSSPSPSLSLSVSGSDIFPREGWPDEVFQYTNSAAASLYDAVKFGSSTALLDNLHAKLKIKEGEVQQLQSQVQQAERLRDTLTTELTALSQRAEEADELSDKVKLLESGQQELEAKYQTMLTMYGEKVEEAEELRLDLMDVKDMYKTQIEQLIGKQSIQ